MFVVVVLHLIWQKVVILLHCPLFFFFYVLQMDYGGHDSIFEDNLVISYPNMRARSGVGGPKCINFGSFLERHGHIVRNNHCIVPNENQQQPLTQLEACRTFHGNLHNNSYYTPTAQAWLKCNWNDNDPSITITDAAKTYGIESGSRVLQTPDIDSIMAMTLKTLFPQSSSSVEEVSFEQ